eukprot:jgi/Bigna1/143030/aug1.75_g17738
MPTATSSMKKGLDTQIRKERVNSSATVLSSLSSSSWGKAGYSSSNMSIETLDSNTATSAENWSKAAVDEKTAKHQRMRRKIADELLATERTYVKWLDIICDKFYVPLKERVRGSKKVLSRREMDLIFSDIALIRNLNKNFLSVGKKEKENKTSRIPPNEEMYRQFVENAENAKTKKIMAKLEAKSRTNKEFGLGHQVIVGQAIHPFARFCEEVCAREGCLPFAALLIAPVQRIPRYGLLINEYIKYTDHRHPDYYDLSTSLRKMKEIATFVNDSVRKSQNRAKIMQIKSRFLRDPGFVSPSRLLIHEGTLMKKVYGEDKECWMLLFNDMLAITKKLLPFGRFSVVKKIPVDATFELRDVDSDDFGVEEHSFQIINSVESIQVYAKTNAEKEMWFAAGRRVIEGYQHTRTKSLRNDMNTAMAVLQTERLGSCQRQRRKDGLPCGNRFGIFKRRHLCTKCGTVCCSECAPYKMYIKEGDNKKGRVCTACVMMLVGKKCNRFAFVFNPFYDPIPLVLPRFVAHCTRLNSYQTQDLALLETAHNTVVSTLAAKSTNANSTTRTWENQENVPSGNSREAAQKSFHGTLRILLLEGKNLKMGRLHTPDPFIIFCTADDQKARSKTIKKTTHPEWNQELRVFVDSLENPIGFKVHDARSLSKHAVIGHGSFTINHLADAMARDMWLLAILDGRSSGYIHVKVQFLKAFKKKILRQTRY